MFNAQCSMFFVSLPRVRAIVNISHGKIPATSANPAQKIYIGKDVTDRENQGSVILGQGDITLRTKSVTIKNSTTVPLGTKLKIVNQ